MRDLLRNASVLLAIIVLCPIWLYVKGQRMLGNESSFVTFSQLLSLLPGPVGTMLRRGYHVMCLDKMAWDCGIGFGTWFSHPQVRIDSGVSTGAFCTIGMCHIGSNTLLGSNVDILSGRRQHRFGNAEKPLPEDDGVFTPLQIGANTWIGNSTVIMASVGMRCVIGAGAVVVKEIRNGSVAVGNPAAVKKSVWESSAEMSGDANETHHTEASVEA